MIKLKSLIESSLQSPSPELASYILKNHTIQFSDTVYHGSPLSGIQEILKHGIYGTQHGEVSEYDTFSTSLNSEMLYLFSESQSATGLEFKISNINVVVLNDTLAYLATRLAGSGISFDIDDEEEFSEFVKIYNIPIDGRGRAYFPYDYLSSLGVDAWMYEYVYKQWDRGLPSRARDESEVCFIGKGIPKLNDSIISIYIDGEEYDYSQKKEVLNLIDDESDDD